MVQPPSVDHFRTLLSEPMSIAPVAGRVVIVCGSLQPGGAERQVANTLVGLAGHPHIESLTLLCDYLHSGTQERYDFYLPLAQASGATIRTTRKQPTDDGVAELSPAFCKVRNDLHPGLVADVERLFWEFRSLRPEVVHAWLDWSNVRAGLAALLAGVPRILLSGRNLSPRHFALDADYFHPAYSALLAHGREQVVMLNNSQAGANDYAEWLSLPAESIRVIRNGVHFTDDQRPSVEHAAAFRAKLNIPPQAPLVGGMFRFNEEKRPLLWLRAAARIAQVLPEARFVLFGQGDMRERMERLIQELGIASRVHLHGVVSPSLVGLAPCDLIMLTSRGEGTPNVLLEAQWLGVPVVAIDAGGAAEAANDGVTGLVVCSDDDGAIAEAAIRILKDEGFRATARTEGPAFISSRYGMGRMIDETLKTYRLDTPQTAGLALKASS